MTNTIRHGVTCLVTAVLTIASLPASANPVELFFQDLEGVYSATWFGSLVSKDAGISANVHVVADGKISFDGTVKLSCYQGDYSYDWIYVDPDMFTSDSVPPNVIVKARDVFC